MIFGSLSMLITKMKDTKAPSCNRARPDSVHYEFYIHLMNNRILFMDTLLKNNGKKKLNNK
jgi:hypothetical protein